MSDPTTAYHRLRQDARELFEQHRNEVLAEAAALLLHKRAFLNDVTDPAGEAHALLLAARTTTAQED